MAYKNPNAPIIARYFATDVPDNRRIELGPGQDPSVNEVRFYSGQPSETAYGYVSVQGTQFVSSLSLAPPRLTGTPSIPLMIMQAKSTAPESQIYTEAVVHDFFVTGAGGDHLLSQISADATGDATIKLLGVGSQPEVWQEVGSGIPGIPNFNSTWTNFGGAGIPTLAYQKQATGQVIFKGRVKDTGATSGTIFTLPVGYRPGHMMEFALKSNNDAGSISWIQVNTTGTVNVVGAVAQARVFLSMNSISFLAEL